MFQVFEIFKKIGATSSRNDKEAILQRNFDNEELKTILEYTYNPYKVFGIGSKAFTKKYKNDNQTGFTHIVQLLDYLLENNTGSDRDKMLVNSFMGHYSEEAQEWIKKIVLKDLKIGITEKTINKIWEGLIPTFDVALAEPFDPERIPEEVYDEYKVDGVRTTAIKRKGKTSLFTRNGKAIEGFTDIVDQLNSIPLESFILDGELIGRDYTDTMNKVFRKSSNKEADFIVFDILHDVEFKLGVSANDLKFRREMLENFFETYKDLIPNVLIIPSVYIKNPTLEQLDALCKEAVSLGYEGTMIKDARSTYKCKRSFDWMKMKPFLDGDFEIIRIEEGKGKNKGRMGKVIIDVNGVEVGLGSGWNDEERVDMWENPNKYIGKIVEVQYQELIEKTGSLRFPTVKGIRYDK
jgi:DNA ligase-1